MSTSKGWRGRRTESRALKQPWRIMTPRDLSAESSTKTKVVRCSYTPAWLAVTLVGQIETTGLLSCPIEHETATKSTNARPPSSRLLLPFFSPPSCRCHLPIFRYRYAAERCPSKMGPSVDLQDLRTRKLACLLRPQLGRQPAATSCKTGQCRQVFVGISRCAHSFLSQVEQDT